MATDEIAFIDLSDMTKERPRAILPQSKHASICQLHFPEPILISWYTGGDLT